MALGASKAFSKKQDETLYIDTGDFNASPPDIPLGQFLKPDGDLILDSCSTGAGRENDDYNLVNTISPHLHRGVTIQASDQSTNIRDIRHNASSGKLEVQWRNESLYKTSGQSNE
jgi:hypothetical protein